MKLNNYDIVSATQAEAEFVDNKLSESIRNELHLNQQKTISKNYVIKEEEKVVAGITGVVFPWGILYIDTLFVDEGHREKGLGSRLLQKIEAEAKALGTTLANLNSYEFQAKDFYIKQGYEIFGVLEDSPKGHSLYFLRKNL